MWTRFSCLALKFTMAIEISRGTLLQRYEYSTESFAYQSHAISFLFHRSFASLLLREKDIMPYTLSENQYTISAIHGCIDRFAAKYNDKSRIEVRENSRKRRSRFGKYDFSRKLRTPDNGGVQRIEERIEERERERRETIFGKRVSNLRPSIDVEACSSERSCCMVS